MASTPKPAAARKSQLSLPWTCVVAGLTAIGLGLMVSYVFPAALLPRALLLFGGLLTAGVGVRLRLRTIPVEPDERIEAASLLAVAGVGPVLALVGMERSWDSAAMFLAVLIAASLLGALLVLLPPGGRRVMLSVLVLLHFSAITVAVLAVDLPGAPAPWVVNQLWGRVYRPYLQTTGLTNAYHFYSPEPGPPTLLWFRVTYTNGKSRWVKMPYWEQSAVPLHYQRLLAMSEACSQIQGQVSDTVLAAKLAERDAEGQIEGVPHHPTLPMSMQYRLPTDYACQVVATFARYIARKYPHLDDPADQVEKVRVYRVIHSIITAKQLAEGMSPLDPSLYWPYFMGDYDTQGTLVTPAREGRLLWWLIPIVPEYDAQGHITSYRDYLAVHAGDPESPVSREGGRK